MENILNYLDKLEEEIRNAKRAMLSGNKIIDEAKCVDYLRAIRASLPDEIAEATCIVEEREHMLRQASDQARGIAAHAEEEAKRLLDENDIMRRAQAEADRVVAQAKEYAAYIRREAHVQMDRLLAESESSMGSVLSYIRDCREDLRGGLIKK